MGSLLSARLRAVLACLVVAVLATAALNSDPEAGSAEASSATPQLPSGAAGAAGQPAESVLKVPSPFLPAIDGASGGSQSKRAQQRKQARRNGPPPSGKCRTGRVALTFDDGPSIYTPRLLRILNRLDVPATFFVVGNRVVQKPGLIKKMRAQGFPVANHTWDHPKLTHLENKRIVAQLQRGNRAITKAGAPRPSLTRPPYGLTNDRVRKLGSGMGLREVMWDVDSRDWESGNSRQIAQRILGALRPHSRNIVLQHDGLNRSGLSVGAVPIVVKQARASGYCFVSLKHAKPQPSDRPQKQKNKQQDKQKLKHRGTNAKKKAGQKKSTQAKKKAAKSASRNRTAIAKNSAQVDQSRKKLPKRPAKAKKKAAAKPR